MSNCKDIEVLIGCWTKADGSKETIGIHHTYQLLSGERLIRTRYTDARGGGITIPSTDIVSYGSCCCPDVKEHYLCVNGEKTPVWVSLDSKTLTPLRVVNSLDNTTVDPTLYENGFLNPCEDCCDICTGNSPTSTCIVYKDFAGDLSQATLDNIEFTFTAGCSLDGSVTGIDSGNGLENLANNVNSNLESYINANLGSLGFAAIPTTQPYPDNPGSISNRYMELTYPTCAEWEIVIQNLPAVSNGVYTGIRYSYDGNNLTVNIIDSSGNIVSTFGSDDNIRGNQLLQNGC